VRASAYCHRRWWTDANHAPSGAGYLQMLWVHTNKTHYQVVEQIFSALLSVTEKWFTLRVAVTFSLLGTKAGDELIVDD
jgi:hypothetical protein